MDSLEEDVSARVLLRNVLHTETQSSPVTSASQDQQVYSVRRSARVRNTPRFESPQHTLRNKLKHKLHESATQSPLPSSKRAASRGRTVRTPIVTSPSLYDEEITTRGLLRGIIQTETEASLLLSGQPGMAGGDQEPVDSSIHNSEGGSDLELPDLTTEPLSHVIRGMSRRRALPTFNVSAFERQLDQPSDKEDNNLTEDDTVTKEDDLTTGSKSVLSLTLKTPFVNIRTERAGLQRKAAGRKRASVDAFDKAVQKRLQRHHNQDYTVVQDGKSLGDSEWHKFTLGLSSITVPDLTTNIVMSSTELYAQPPVSVCELKEDESHAAEMETQENEKANMADRQRDEEVGSDQQTGVAEALQDRQNVCPSNITEIEPESLNQLGDLEPDSQVQEEVEMVPSSQEPAPIYFNPEEIPFAPTQLKTMPVSPILEDVVQESVLQETEMEVIGAIERESLPQEELATQLPNQITRRAYHSAGGTVMPLIIAGGNRTKSLGAAPDPTEKELQQITVSNSPEEIANLEDEPHLSPASPSIVHTPKHSSSVTHQKSLAQEENDEEEGHIEDSSGSENDNDVAPSAHLSPTLTSAVDEMPNHEEEEEEEEDEGALSHDISVQTPAFIRQKKRVATPGALATPTVLKPLNTSRIQNVVKSRPKQRLQSVADNVLPKSYVMSVFKHFAKTKVANDVYPVINEILQKYFSRLADDLEAYSAHAKRKTIEVEDVELLMKRQGFVTDSTPLTVLIEKFLPLEYRKLLIPIATSGNKVIPDQRR